MVFSSTEFLFLFLPVTLIAYFITPLRWRNIVLLAVSLIFYGWGEPLYVFLMVFTILVDYVFGYFVGKYRAETKKARALMIISIVINLAILGFFKYADFVIENLARIPVLSALEPMGLELPIGISFYTFQALSYVIDVYRGDARAQKNPINFATYVTFFPQLIAGPIVRYHDIDLQLDSRVHSVAMSACGVRTFVAGLAKKVLIGNTAGALWTVARDMPADNRTAVIAWFGIICFTAQIYFDFSGYSDMAIGLGKIFGFKFLANFNYPYISRSITDFWRRWHISLSTWFREYVYIPLGGNRCSRGRMFFNLFVVWLLTGLWHGANWNFILWGLYYFIILIVEKAFLGKLLEKLPAALRVIYSMLLIIFGWLIFVFDGSEPTLDVGHGLVYLKNMFGIGGGGFVSATDVYDIVRHAVLLTVMVLAATPYPKRLYYRLCEKSRTTGYLSALLCVAGFALCVLYLVNSSYNPFLYFRF